MALILNIDTATESAIITLSEKDKVVDAVINTNQKDHASFLQPAIKNLLQKADVPVTKLNAVAVTHGPGSYTGIRVGMATAKGLCYALNIPLITINSLEVIALSSIEQVQDKNALYCAMIDARRMEVFTAVYDHQLKEIIKPSSMILDNMSFKDVLKTTNIYFSGSGSIKLKEISHDAKAFFLNNKIIPGSMAKLSHEKYEGNMFSDVLYSTPLYLKEFYTL